MSQLPKTDSLRRYLRDVRSWITYHERSIESLRRRADQIHRTLRLRAQAPCRSYRHSNSD